MVHQPRRRRARIAVLLLGVLVLAGAAIGRLPSDGPLGQRSARAATVAAPTTAATRLLDARTAPVFAALNRERTSAGLVEVALDPDLVDDASGAACAIMRGDLALDGDGGPAGSDGGRQNVGLVVDDDPAAGAAAMHSWWTATHDHRRDRMAPRVTRYGIGACTDGDRTYYVERLTL